MFLFHIMSTYEDNCSPSLYCIAGGGVGGRIEALLTSHYETLVVGDLQVVIFGLKTSLDLPHYYTKLRFVATPLASKPLMVKCSNVEQWQVHI